MTIFVSPLSRGFSFGSAGPAGSAGLAGPACPAGPACLAGPARPACPAGPAGPPGLAVLAGPAGPLFVRPVRRSGLSGSFVFFHATWMIPRKSSVAV